MVAVLAAVVIAREPTGVVPVLNVDQSSANVAVDLAPDDHDSRARFSVGHQVQAMALCACPALLIGLSFTLRLLVRSLERIAVLAAVEVAQALTRVVALNDVRN